jgi:hypothetical protein
VTNRRDTHRESEDYIGKRKVGRRLCRKRARKIR